MMQGRPNLQHRVIRRDNARYQGGTRELKIRGAVWHATAGDTSDGAIGWQDRMDVVVENGRKVSKLLPPSKRSSYTYHIDKDGSIIRTVHPGIIALHAGASKWKGLTSLNRYTIGIAFANDNGSDSNPDDDELTYEQLESGLWLGTVCMETYGYGRDWNPQHREVSPGRKQDVAPHILDADFWREQLALPEWPERIYARRPLCQAA